MTKTRLSMVAAVLSACVLGSLTGCGDSSTAGADQRVRDASDRAARIAGSAGADRPTDELTSKVEAAGWQRDQQDKLDTSLTGALKGKDYAAVQKQVEVLLKHKSVEEDLTRALKELNDATTGEASGDVGWAQIQQQIGDTSGALASVQMDNAQAQVRDLVSQALEIQLVASEIARLGAEAGVGDTQKAVFQKALDADGGMKAALSAARAESTSIAGKLQTVTGEVAALQKQIDDKRAEAQQARTQAHELQSKSDQAKGDDSIKIFDQSAEFSNKAAAALAEAGRLQPQLDDKTAEQQILQTDSKAAEAKVASFESVQGSMEKTVTGADDSKKTAQGLMDKKMEDFDKKITAFNAGADAAQALLGKIVLASAGSKSNYSKALDAWGKYKTTTLEQHPVGSSRGDHPDPLTTIASGKQLDALLDLSIAQTLNRSGQAHLLTEAVVQMKQQVASLKSNPNRAPASGTDSDERTKAYQDFTSATTTAKKYTAMADLKSTPMAWLSWMVLAISQEGQAISSSGQPSTTAHNDAVSSAAQAQTLNPLLVIQSAKK